MSRLREEIFAYISGEINNANAAPWFTGMFRDYTEAQAAWYRFSESAGTGATEVDKIKIELPTRASAEAVQPENTGSSMQKAQKGPFVDSIAGNAQNSKGGLLPRAGEVRQRRMLPTAAELGRQYRENVAAQQAVTNKEMQTGQAVSQMAAALGARVVFDETIADAAGNEGAANGYYQDGVLHIARDADKPVLAVAKHELTHHIQQAAPEEYSVFRDYAMGLQGPDAVQETIARYAKGGVQLTEEEAMDEIAADFTESLLTDRASIEGLINDNPTLAQRFFTALRELLQKLTGTADPTLSKAERLWTDAYRAAQGAKNTATESGGEARYSIKYDRNNTPYVNVDRDILAGVPRSKWVKTVKENLRQKFPEGVTVGRSVIDIDKQSIREMTFSRYTQRLMKTEPNLFADKLRATDSADEILKASRNYENEALLHPRKDNIQEFARGEVLLRIGDNDYTGQVVVAMRSNGRLLLYDLLNLKRTAIKEKAGSSKVDTVNPQSGTGSQAEPSNSTLPQEGGEVKAGSAMKERRAAGMLPRAGEVRQGGLLPRARETQGAQRVANAYDGKSLSEDSTVYSYDFLTALPDMRTTALPEVSAVRDANGKVDTGKVVTAGMKNARSAGTERDGKVFVKNDYTGKQLLVTSESIRHGLNGALNRLLTNARLGAVIGDVVKNAVPINALHNKAEGVNGTYAMAAYTTDSVGREIVAIVTVEQYDGNISGIEAYDVTHAVSGRQKRGQVSDPHTRSRGFTLSSLSEISISDLLEIVNKTHQSILSEDVLEHLGETRSPDGEYTGQVKFSLKRQDAGELLKSLRAERREKIPPR